MTPPPRLVRRVVVDPLFLLIIVVLAGCFLVVLLLGVLAAPFTRRRRVLRLATLALVYLGLDVALLFGGLWLWLRRLGLRAVNATAAEDAWVAAHASLLSGALGVLTRAARRTVGFRVACDDGCPIPPRDGRPLVALARHAGPGDSFALAWLILQRWDRVPRVVLKDVLQWDPGLDVILTRLTACFLSFDQDDSQANACCIAGFAARLSGDDVLLIFPEGGNWTPARHERVVQRLRRTGRWRAARRAAARANVLPPRPAGTAAALGVRPDLDVVVIAHAGLDRLTSARSIWEAIPMTATPMRIHWWIEPAADVPRAEEAATTWLNQRWIAVDDWVGEHHATRPSPAVTFLPESPR